MASSIRLTRTLEIGAGGEITHELAWENGAQTENVALLEFRGLTELLV